MSMISMSDLSQSLLLRKDNARLRQDLLTATRELSTGRRENVFQVLGGDVAPLADIEVGLARSVGYLNNIAEQRLRYGAAQAALASIRQIASEISGPLVLVQETSDSDLVRNAGRDAMARFDTLVSTLNTTAAGASLFAGVSTDSPALADARTILDVLEGEVVLSGAATASDVTIAVEAWFAPGGGFETLGYVGGSPISNGLSVSETAVAEPLMTAADPEVRNLLSAFSLSALIGRGTLGTNPDEQAKLARDSGLRLLTADEGLVELQAAIGTQENRVERAEVETRARKGVLEMARTELIGVDPFEAATLLQATEGQLESLYAMTARLSRLSLTDYLR